MTPIDFCVPINGPNALPLCRVAFGSLLRVADLEGVTIRVFNKDVPRGQLLPFRGFNCDIFEHGLPDFHQCDAPTHVGLAADWIVNFCGIEKWCVLAHFDVLYKSDILSLMRERMNDRVGMLGQHCPIMAINRDAYRQSTLKFKSVAQFFAVPPTMTRPDTNGMQSNWKLRWKEDPRAKVEGAIPIMGFDTGELLELELRSLGWEVDPMIDEIADAVVHVGQGGTGKFEENRRWAEKMIAEHGY